MALRSRHRLERQLVPKDLSRDLIQTEQAPLVRLCFSVRIDVAVQTDFEVRLSAGFHSGSDIDPVLPHNRAGMAQTRDWRLPANIRAGLSVPANRCGVFGNAAGGGSTELRPVNCGSGKSRSS